VKVGIIGFGSMGRNHARVVQRMRDCELVGFYDPEFVPGEDYIELQKNSLNELLSYSLDYLVVASPTPSHFELVTQLLHTKIPLLVEKPICGKSVESKELSSMIPEIDFPIGVGHVERFNPAVASSREIIKSGLIGEIISVDTFRKGPNPNRNLGVGVMLDLMSHDIDTTMWLTGQKYSEKSAIFFQSEKSYFEDLAHFQGKTESGTLIRHQVDWISPIKIRQSRILGSKGMMTIDTISNSLHLSLQSKDGPKIEVINPSPSSIEPLEMEHLHFQQMITGVPSNIATIHESLEVVDVIFSLTETL
jgi:UDP-N-acetylglucosamine 3-dehydrogenase